MQILSERQIILTPAIMAARTYRPPAVMPRSKGVHVQAVNRKLGEAAGVIDSSDSEDYPFERFSDDLYPLMPALGVAWEEFRASCWPEEELIWQPGELERDGIFGTPDGLILGGAQDIIWECKQTTKKLQRIDKCWMYMKQGMCYCAMNGLRQVLYEVCFLLGDYSRPYKPVATQTLVEFKEGEIEKWWHTIKTSSVGLVQRP